ncbi:AraC family transcriptional regulator [Leifsonia sp. Le1]|uniref:helix-turn-helix transcriptional regulator n=1 Tax=Leifsonia sp. Le1 TaxID=3404918 RepID=UPI003EBF9C9B
MLAAYTEDGTSIVPANRVGWIPAGFAHFHRAHGDSDMRIVFLTPALASLLPARPAVFLVSSLARELLLAITGHGQAGDGHPDYSSSARGRLLRVLVDELHDAADQPLHLPEPSDDRLRAVTQALYDAPGDNSTLEALGRRVGASGRTLSRLFASELGMTFYQWRTQLRIYHALTLLADGWDITQTAYACGWANPSGFITAFSELIGTTPGRYKADLQPKTLNVQLSPHGRK